MNMLDMHTREKVNKLHIAEMHREAQNRHFLRGLNPPGFAVPPRVQARKALALVLLALLVVTLLSSASAYY
jgi:hypothetical protein